MAVDQGRYARGLQATLHLCQGDETKSTDLVIHGDTETWAEFQEHVGGQAACLPQDVQSALMREQAKRLQS